MNRRFLSILVAAALAVLGVVLVMVYVGTANRSAIDKVQPVRVLAVKQPINAGTTGSAAISGGLLHIVREPRGSLPPGYVTRMSHQQSIDVFTSALHAGQIITANMFGTEGQISTPLIVPGHGKLVDAAIRVCEADAVGGDIGPGAYVAIVNTAAINPAHPITPSCQAHQPSVGGVRTKLVLPDVEVRAVDDTAPPISNPSGGAPTTTPLPGAQGCAAVSQGEECVIVAVTMNQALKLEAVNITGQLALFLLNGDNTPAGGTAYGH